MNRGILGLATFLVACQIAWAQESPRPAQTTASPEEQAIRERLKNYLEAFNRRDAAVLVEFWTADGVSVAEETGERTEGRQKLQDEFASFFQESPDARLVGQATSLRLIRPDVAVIEGRTTLFVGEADPVESAFTAILVKEGDQWMISSSHERDLPAPNTAYDALKELEWLIGTWEDQSEEVQITTSIRWSPNRAFLIRSFSAQYGEDDSLQGTQVIGWDPLKRQIRTWTFHSDGSFGEGTASRDGDEWMLKLAQVLSDGRVAAATQIITRVDNDTLTVQTVGQTVEGEPVPASDPVTVVRTGGEEAVSSTNAPADAGGTR
ncbi:MAG: nuclear transport factor 2 family protein [Planctomycetaceae bacterium]|nr:nuclear transport factor 2 family protein [Planctomycetaceae bacterium]